MVNITTDEQAFIVLKKLARQAGLDMTGAKVRRTSSRFCLGVEHGDYNGTELAGVGTDRFIWMAYKPNNDGVIRIFSGNFPEEGIVEVPLTGEIPEPKSAEFNEKLGDRWARYLFGLRYTRDKDSDQFKNKWRKQLTKGYDAVLAGNIPGGGMSRSASLCGNKALSWLDVNGIQINNDADMMHVVDWAQAIENIYVGSPCGKLDQIMIFFAKENMLTHYNPKDRSVRYVPLGEGSIDFRILSLDTGTIRPGLGESTYKLRREQCEELVNVLQEKEYIIQEGKNKGKNVTCLADITDKRDVEAIRKIEPPPMFEKGITYAGWADGRREFYRWGDLVDRLAYIRAAQQRFYKDILAGWEQGDIVRVGQAFRADGIGLRDVYKISGPELETMCDIARTVPGVLGERMLGGGDKGASGALVKAEAVDAVKATVDAAYPRSRPDFADKYAVHVLKPVAGITVFEGKM